jgi:hypothetical protein
MSGQLCLQEGQQVCVYSDMTNTLTPRSRVLCSSLKGRYQVSHPYKTGKTIGLCILILNFWIANWKTKESVLNDGKRSAQVHAALNFCTHEILIYLGCSQTFELFHPFKKFITYI